MSTTRNDYDGTSTSFESYNVIANNEPSPDLGLFPAVALSSQKTEPHDGQYIAVILAFNRPPNWPCNLLPEMAALLPVFDIRHNHNPSASYITAPVIEISNTSGPHSLCALNYAHASGCRGILGTSFCVSCILARTDDGRLTIFSL